MCEEIENRIIKIYKLIMERNKIKATEKWNSPVIHLPDTDRDVIVNTTSLGYMVVFYNAEFARNCRWNENNGSIDDDMILSWHELPGTWNDPKLSLPDTERDVIIKINSLDKYHIASYRNRLNYSKSHWILNNGCLSGDDIVIGWQDIPK